jgi:DNA polymerase-3 subunit alpha
LVAKLAGVVSAKQERKSARGNRYAFVSLSDPTGLYEVTVFSETLEAARDHLEPGCNVVLSVEATMEAEQLKLLCKGVTPVEGVVADAGVSGLKIYFDARADVAPVMSLLDRVTRENPRRSVAPVSLCLLLDDADLAEVDIPLPQAFAVNPQIKSAVKSLPGVVMIEDL